jgi:hypothetical protein
MKGQIRIPDVALVSNPTLPPSGSNLSALVEMKMPGDKGFDNPKVRAQVLDYARIAGGTIRAHRSWSSTPSRAGASSAGGAQAGPETAGAE